MRQPSVSVLQLSLAVQGDVRERRCGGPGRARAPSTYANQEELRRRGVERARSQMELDYINRLLKQF
jgi:hypothetical protein